MASFLIYINGEKRQVKVDGSTPLLWVLRDNLKLTGTKYGCGRGLCGACTVHINGEATRSCITAIENAAGSNITTIEGLSKDSDHPVQKAWVAEDVPQCGYCQSGQIMTAAAFLERNSNPDESDINAAMKMNICRCGTYQRIRKAIGRAAEELQNG
ncbi:MAG TPA: (2Fe-2S)-binding protein [Candidatus Marinimicrobia bacterium]|jgi:isoquinoline 1-oxidoreductase alpha subunit|nr:(2Fe-2S)-binding protein [Candidatus Neomarinimicrobiota bacterium]|tara:strand:- start:209 stop:676 length:468 start_codon:yes stop_codon:yes gene_type:complete